MSLPACPYCRMPPGRPCKSATGKLTPTHQGRVKLARVLAGHADPVLDEWFPRLGACGLCGTPGLDARHRVVDAIAGRLEGGETAGECAADYGLPVDAVGAVRAWANRWPGAWG